MRFLRFEKMCSFNMPGRRSTVKEHPAEASTRICPHTGMIELVRGLVLPACGEIPGLSGRRAPSGFDEMPGIGSAHDLDHEGQRKRMARTLRLETTTNRVP